MENCGTCFYRKVSIYGPLYDTLKLSCKKGYKLNTFVQPSEKDCWKAWSKKALFKKENHRVFTKEETKRLAMTIAKENSWQGRLVD